MNLSNKKLGLFFTRANSLWTWKRIGHLEREVAPYNKLADYFDEIYFFTYGDEDDLKYQEYLASNIKIFPKKWRIKSKIYSLLLPFLRWKEIKKCAILKTNQMAGSWSAVFAKWISRKKLVVRCGHEWLLFSELKKRSRWRLKLIYLAEKLAYKNADKIILATEADKDFVVKRFGISDKKITIIPNYIDTDLFKPNKRRLTQMNDEIADERGNDDFLYADRVRNKDYIPRESALIEKDPRESAILRICYVGRFREQKNIENLIKAVADLDVKLAIFGIGALSDKLKNLAKKLNAPVEFKGTIPNTQLPEELNKSDLFILPSLFEGNPKTLLEAMSCGLPCIGTNVVGIKEIIRHEENGYLCDTDANSIKKAITEVLGDKNLQQKMGVNARKTVLENFSLDKNLQKELNVYTNL